MSQLAFYGRRVTLREFHESDISDYVALRAEPQFASSCPLKETEESYHRKLVQQFIDSQKVTPRRIFQLAIVFDNTLIGSCGIRILPSEVHATLGYEVASQYWGWGMAVEACRLMVHFAFLELNIKTIYADINQHNMASQRVLEKLNFQKEPMLWPDTKRYYLSLYMALDRHGDG